MSPEEKKRKALIQEALDEAKRGEGAAADFDIEKAMRGKQPLPVDAMLRAMGVKDYFENQPPSPAPARESLTRQGMMSDEELDKAYAEGVAKLGPKKIAYTYAVFIEDIKKLVAEAHTLPAAERNAGSMAFKRWKHSLQDGLEEVRKLGFSPRCSVEGKIFAAAYSNERGSQRAFEDDMGTTLIELEQIIKNFDRSGEPIKKPARTFGSPAPAAAPAPSPAVPAPVSPAKPDPLSLDWPDKMPFLWYVKKGSPGLYAFYGGSLVFVASAAFAIASWPTISTAMAHAAEKYAAPTVTQQAVKVPAASASVPDLDLSNAGSAPAAIKKVDPGITKDPLKVEPKKIPEIANDPGIKKKQDDSHV